MADIFPMFCEFNKQMAEIAKEESEYVLLPNIYSFPSREERERVLCKNFLQVGVEVKNMIWRRMQDRNDELKSCARHESGCLKMKKLIFLSQSLSAVLQQFSASVHSLHRIKRYDRIIHTHSYAVSKGKHCNGTVGCDCSRISQIVDGMCGMEILHAVKNSSAL